jgi:hypothetical protein
VVLGNFLGLGGKNTKSAEERLAAAVTPKTTVGTAAGRLRMKASCKIKQIMMSLRKVLNDLPTGGTNPEVGSKTLIATGIDLEKMAEERAIHITKTVLDGTIQNLGNPLMEEQLTVYILRPIGNEQRNRFLVGSKTQKFDDSDVQAVTDSFKKLIQGFINSQYFSHQALLAGPVTLYDTNPVGGKREVAHTVVLKDWDELDKDAQKRLLAPKQNPANEADLRGLMYCRGIHR